MNLTRLAAPIFLLVAASLFSARLIAQTSDLPTGFGGVNIGDRWEDVEEKFGFRNLDRAATEWDRYVHECGFRIVAVDADRGEILLTFNDFVVTQIAFITPLQNDSDLMAVADLVMKTYGQPDRASMRNLLGRVTIDRANVNYVTLAYQQRRPVEFTITGRELWQYQIAVTHERARWHENKTVRCARKLERESRKKQSATETEG